MKSAASITALQRQFLEHFWTGSRSKNLVPGGTVMTVTGTKHSQLDVRPGSSRTLMLG